MSVIFPFAETFTIVSRDVSGQDEDGNDAYVPSESTTTGAFAPEGSTELTQGRETVLTHDTIYLSDGAPVPAATDQVRARGVLYDIDGAPAVYRNPFTGEAPGAVLRLLRVTG